MERDRQEAYADEVRRVEDAVGRSIGARVPAVGDLAVISKAADAVFNEEEATWLAGIATARQVASTIDQEWITQLGRRQRFQNTGAALSPGSALSLAVSDLAGVGHSTEQAWEQAVRAHHGALSVALFDNKPMVNLRVPVGSNVSLMVFRRHASPRYAELPAFHAPENGFRDHRRTARWPLAWLALQTALAFGFAYCAGLKDTRRFGGARRYGR
jgi:hypothetical protein